MILALAVAARMGGALHKYIMTATVIAPNVPTVTATEVQATVNALRSANVDAINESMAQAMTTGVGMTQVTWVDNTAVVANVSPLEFYGASVPDMITGASESIGPEIDLPLTAEEGYASVLRESEHNLAIESRRRTNGGTI
jgi:hypothetical protein